MSTSEEEELGHDDTLDAALRELARLPAVPPDVAQHVRVPSTIDMPAVAVAEALAVVPSPRPGDTLEGRWRIESELGSGGMGTVFRARNLRTEGAVAIKWLSARGAGSPAQRHRLVERFRREARAAAGIRHPNVVDVYDVGGTDDAPFLVMELLEGEPLRERMARGPFAWEDACRILIPLMRGVAAAHRAGIVHRDIKPDNLFLCEADGQVLPKVLDFGVAAMRSDSSDGQGPLTHSGMIVGTPSYMPLEQLTGREVDERADVYAFGVVLYEMLTGTLPFAARNASELAVLQAKGQPVAFPDSCAALRGAREAVVMKALARDPGERYPSLDVFCQSLDIPAASRARPRRGLSRRIVVLGAVLLVGVLGFSLFGADRAPARPTHTTKLQDLQATDVSHRPSAEVSTTREPTQEYERPVPAASVAPQPSASGKPSGDSRADPKAQPSPSEPPPRQTQPLSGLRRANGTPESRRDPTDLTFDDF